jgi:uncharacterized membrane protein
MTLSGRYVPFYAATVTALAVALVVFWIAPRLIVPTAANGFFLTYLAFEYVRFPKLTAAFLRDFAASEDPPAFIIIFVGFAAMLAAIIALFVLLNTRGGSDWGTIGVTLSSVALGWLTVHTMAALHYAHAYWRPEGDPNSAKTPHAGLEFPGTSDPEGYDFLYFSLVTGMTAQTSDVAITSTQMRLLNLLHAVVSFFFNTVLVAAAVNVAVSLAGTN